MCWTKVRFYLIIPAYETPPPENPAANRAQLLNWQSFEVCDDEVGD
jgi:hypothetical protein